MDDIFIKLLNRCEYAGCYDILNHSNMASTDICKLLRVLKHMVNFDFDFAGEILSSMSDEFKNKELYNNINKHLNLLIKGNSNAMFFELMFSMKLQLGKDEYIDFLGRLYRFREAVYKYLFVITHHKKNVDMNSEIMSKNHQLDILRNHYKIQSYNLTSSILKYLRQYYSNNIEVMSIVRILEDEKMVNLMHLRNKTIIGHGFIGASLNDIKAIYGDIDRLISDIKRILKLLKMDIDYNRYDYINNEIKKLYSIEKK